MWRLDLIVQDWNGRRQAGESYWGESHDELDNIKTAAWAPLLARHGGSLNARIFARKTKEL